MSKKRASKTPTAATKGSAHPMENVPPFPMHGESQDGRPYLAGVRDAVAVAADLCRRWVDGDDRHMLTRGEGWGRLYQGRSVSEG